MMNPNMFLAAAGSVAFIVCLSVLVGIIFIAAICLLWWTEIRQKSMRELSSKIKSGLKNFGNLISSNKPVKTVYSDKGKNFSGTEQLPIPKKKGEKEYTYEFMGWNKNFVSEDGKTIAKPVFIKRVNTCRVNFYDEDKTTLLKSGVVEYGAGLDLSDLHPSKPETKEFSYEFVGWDKDTTKFYKNENIYAVYKAIPKKFTYTFYDADGKSIVSQMTAIYGTPILLPEEPEAEDKSQIFAYWKGYEDGMLLVKDESFTPVFKKNTSIMLKTTIADEAMQKQSSSSYNYDREEQKRSKQKVEKQLLADDSFLKKPFKIFASKDTNSDNEIKLSATDVSNNADGRKE